MNPKPNILLTNARLAIGVIVPLITVLFFFFQLQTDILANADHIDRNTKSIVKMENKLEGMEVSMNELIVDIRVMTVQMDTMMKTMERMEKKLEKTRYFYYNWDLLYYNGMRGFIFGKFK